MWREKYKKKHILYVQEVRERKKGEENKEEVRKLWENLLSKFCYEAKSPPMFFLHFFLAPENAVDTIPLIF